MYQRFSLIIPTRPSRDLEGKLFIEKKKNEFLFIKKVCLQFAVRMKKLSFRKIPLIRTKYPVPFERIILHGYGIPS